MTIGNTPRECDTSDTAINRLIESEASYMRASQTEDWQIDVSESGSMIGECPRCGCRDISAVTPESLQCNGCGHRDGTQYRAIDMGRDAPNELRALPAETDEEGLNL